ncbi:MAG: M81 family metallopeptidase [Alphaproteobacteria bacterium]|nr:M81 family metallopeptidase [Alphaproteobacteria bacterium]MBU1563072.1 M81 family metallopeptidase [Alphaproteobacteria bacterium]MBU2304267.1 M81 family metallopeptidase [Alphaproteobacteria bacterium]MBU2368268.1 M81 family metallopeptidase [Alphaproteobacteria bacterium]
MRIAVAGLHTECSTYNPVLAREADFRVLRGPSMLKDAYFDFLTHFPAEFITVLHARAIAGGPVEGALYVRWKAEILDGIRAALPLDGVYLAMHGAMFVEGLFDAEGDFIAAVRDLVGPDVLIAASYDLHGNVSQQIIDSLDIFSTYRTAPHIDVPDTMRRAVTMLVRALTTGQRPVVAWAPVPVLLPGERTSTQDEPARTFYTQLSRVEDPTGIWDASFQVGYVWADEPRSTACAVVTGTDRAAMTEAGRHLAQNYWDIREGFVFGTRTGSIADCVSWAMTAGSGPAVLAESGDNPTGGGVGDRAEVLAELIARGAQGVVFAGIADKPATDAAYAAGVGQSIDISIGATLDPSSKPVQATAEVVFLLETDDARLREAVVRIGGIDLVLTARRRPFHNIADFTRLGLDPRKAKIVVVKSGYLSPDLGPIANPSLMALSPGVVDQFVERLERKHKSIPQYPFDKDFAFTPEVRWSKRAG